jgi:hypothetical protein
MPGIKPGTGHSLLAKRSRRAQRAIDPGVGRDPFVNFSKGDRWVPAFAGTYLRRAAAKRPKNRYREGRKGVAEDATASRRLKRHHVPSRILRVLCAKAAFFWRA